MQSSAPAAAAKALFAAVTAPGAGESMSREEWLDVLSSAQEAMNVLAGAQAVAMAHAAAHDHDDRQLLGPLSHRGLGHCALDAPDLVAGRLGCSAQAATGRLAAAVAQVTSMPVLVEAMGSGALDSFRAAVVADELADAEAEVRALVVERLAEGGRLTAESAGPLRRRARKILGALAPEVIEARVTGARVRRALFRSTEHAGLDHWEGWLPVETSRPAWAAVTGLAQDYLREGRAVSLSTARADALADLILGHARGTYVFHPTVSATELEGSRDDPVVEWAGEGAVVAVAGLGAPGETLVSRAWLQQLAASPRRRGRGSAASRVTVRVGDGFLVDDRTGAISSAASPDGSPSPTSTPKAEGYRPSATLARVVRARDGRCRFPGCAIPVRYCDLDHVIAYDRDEPARGGPTDSGNLVCLCRRHHRIKQRPGWSSVLHADGSLTWTDPTGRQRTTWPEDHRPSAHPALGSYPRPGPRSAPPAGNGERDKVLPSLDPAELEPFSVLEDQLADRLEAWLADLTAESTVTVHRAGAREPLRGARRRRSRHRGRGREESGLVVHTVVDPRIGGRRIRIGDELLTAAAAARGAPPF